MDHAVNLMFGEIYRQLYQQEIPINDIVGGKKFIVDEVLLKNSGYEKSPSFTGEYSFHVEKKKADESKTKTAYLLNLIFLLKDKGEEADQKLYHFEYKIFVLHESAQGNDNEVSGED